MKISSSDVRRGGEGRAEATVLAKLSAECISGKTGGRFCSQAKI